MRRFLEKLLDRLSNKDKAKSTLWMVSAAVFLAISGTIGIILLLCVSSSSGTETPSFNQFSTPTSSSPLIDINPVEHASTFRLTAYVALGLVVFASVAYCGTQFGFLLARRRTVRRLHQAIKSTDLEAAFAKLARAPQFKPAGSLSAGIPPSDLNSDRDGVSPALRRTQNGTAASNRMFETIVLAKTRSRRRLRKGRPKSLARKTSTPRWPIG